ncbi:hypothetical protein CDC53_16440 [Salmonella enterica subsp. enterica serovar Enteritidis]|nr:hypothetical protein CDC53_16440 [Salmonella enterica subsp. enterica serovar Enteritidis]
MLLVSLLLLWLAIAKKFEPLLLLPIGFGGLLSNIPEAGMALTALESLLAHHDAGQLAVIAAKLLRPAAGQPAHPAAGGGGAVRHLRHRAGGADAELLRPDFLHPAAGGGNRHYRRRGRPDGDLSVGQAGPGAAGGHRGGGVLVYGAGAVNPAADYARADQRERAQNPHGAAAHGE